MKTTPTTRKSDDPLRISDYVLHNDHQLIAFNKPGGMPTQDDKTGDASLHKLAQAYSKRDLYVVHRLDRPCSGIVIFAKTQAAAAHLSEQWRARTITKKYLAVITRGLTPTEGTLQHNLLKRGNKSIVVTDGSEERTDGSAADIPIEGSEHREEGGKTEKQNTANQATLSYKVVTHHDKYDLLEVTTHTGYFHQIRAQFAAAGFPIKDDVKYGARRSNKERTISLHCTEVSFLHPGTNQKLTLQCPPPDEVLWKVGASKP